MQCPSCKNGVEDEAGGKRVRYCPFCGFEIRPPIEEDEILRAQIKHQDQIIGETRATIDSLQAEIEELQAMAIGPSGEEKKKGNPYAAIIAVPLFFYVVITGIAFNQNYEQNGMRGFSIAVAGFFILLVVVVIIFLRVDSARRKKTTITPRSPV